MARDRPDEDRDYEEALRNAQIELVRLQKHIIKHEQKLLIVFEGRDAAGKDGTIKRIVQHLSPRETRVAALGAPSDRDRRAWYFQRFVEHLPVSGEIVLFNRSWYNRAGVEHVMGFCSEEEHEQFLKTVPLFEQLLVHCGFSILKYYLDITRDEQEKRLSQRKKDPLRQWKMSPIDAKAQKHWVHYSEARDVMLTRTHSVIAQWIIMKADDKHAARLNVIRDALLRCDFHDKRGHGEIPDPNVVFLFDEMHLRNGRIAP